MQIQNKLIIYKENINIIRNNNAMKNNNSCYRYYPIIVIQLCFQVISLINKDIFMLIFIICIMNNHIKIIFIKNKIRNEKKKPKEKIRYSDIKNAPFKINIIKNKQNKINSLSIFIVKLLTIFNIYKQIKSIVFKYKDSKIYLKIKGEGENTILSNDKYTNFKGINFLKDVFINGDKQETNKFSYYFNQTDNFVELIFDDNINDCRYMLYNCTNITEINLSNFNTSNVTNMEGMFAYCSSLTSLDLSNFDTSQVTHMLYMFYNCSSLISLDLSNFNTSNVTNMESMFAYCSSLTSLDLSNFDTSQVTDMFYMFPYCSSLTSLNLSNFNNRMHLHIKAIFFFLL